MAVVIVAGALANTCGNGGEAWVRLNWALGLRQLGFDVWLLEHISSDICVDGCGQPAAFEESINLAYFQQITSRFGLAAALICDGGDRVAGATWSELLDLADAAVLLINISGHLTLDPIISRIRRRAYIDIDPGFTQFWHVDVPAARLRDHEFYFTIGENIGTALSDIPTGGIAWRRTRQPVVLGEWPVVPVPSQTRFTTIASWRGRFGPVRSGKRVFGLKVHEFRKFIELPRRAAHAFELALDIHAADGKDLVALQEHGWQVTDPAAAAADPDLFRRYVQGSSAEFSVAQGIYVDTVSGWFSDRTVRYLATGRPALVQDTGFGRQLPTGEGLLAFRTLAEAVAGADAIAADPERHSRAARAIAKEYFDSDRVLGTLLDQVGVEP